MSLELLTLGMFVTLIMLIVLGLPLAYSLAGTAVIFGLIENGFNLDGLFGFYINKLLSEVGSNVCANTVRY